MRLCFQAFVAICLLFNTAVADEIDQIRARNDAIEARLMALRMEQARAILAGELKNQTWKIKIVQINNYASDINLYYQAGQIENGKLSINASQTLIKELVIQYTKKVYGDKSWREHDEDPFIGQFVKIYKILERMKRFPVNQMTLSSRLDQELTVLDDLISSTRK